MTANNLLKRITLALALFASQLGVPAQAFVNLDFELAHVQDLPPNTSEYIPAMDAFPGWTPYFNGFPSPSVFHNGTSIGGEAVDIYGPGWTHSPILQGRYSAGLTTSLGPPENRTAAIGQTGQIPPSARSLTFRAGKESNLSVTFADHPLALITQSSTASFDRLAADISSFAGQTGELRFTVIPSDTFTGVGHATIDLIAFSPNLVPEPGPLGLFALGFGLLNWRRKPGLASPNGIARSVTL